MEKVDILIVEDEFVNAQLLQEVIREIASSVLVAENGKVAVDLVKSNPEIDLVLMDLRMPVMDGYTATKLIKEFRSDLPVIALTAFALDDEDFKAENNGFYNILLKPINKKELFDTIHEIVINK